MSWSVSIPPYVEGGPFEVEAAGIEQAINDAQPVGVEMASGPAAQLAAAKDLATDLVTGVLGGKRAYKISLAGHADPGDKTTAPDQMSLTVTEVR